MVGLRAWARACATQGKRWALPALSPGEATVAEMSLLEGRGVVNCGLGNACLKVLFFPRNEHSLYALVFLLSVLLLAL
jgi:hypothetical protein